MTFNRKRFFTLQRNALICYQHQYGFDNEWDALKSWFKFNLHIKFLQRYLADCKITTEVKQFIDEIGFCTCSPDSFFDISISSCCYAHDVCYCFLRKKSSRKLADKLLRQKIYQVLRKAGRGRIVSFAISSIYHRAVRRFGKYFFNKNSK